MVRKKKKPSIGAAAPSPSSAAALKKSAMAAKFSSPTKHNNIVLGKSPVAASTPKSINGAGQMPDEAVGANAASGSRSSSSEMDLKARSPISAERELICCLVRCSGILPNTLRHSSSSKIQVSRKNQKEEAQRKE
jgi:hypothetical protein